MSRNGPPATRPIPVRETVQGVEIIDPYRWLENQNGPETRAWIEAQDAPTRSFLSVLPGREKLKQRLTELMKADTLPFPIERNGRYFFSRRLAGQDLFVLYMRKGLAGKDEVLIDPHSRSADHSVSVSLMNVSQDGALLAYGVRQGGEDEVSLNLLDTRKTLPDRLPKGR